MQCDDFKGKHSFYQKVLIQLYTEVSNYKTKYLKTFNFL